MRTMAFVRNGEAPSDLRDDERTALTYTTPVLRRDVELSGPITLRLFATATAPDFDWAVRLTDVHPDGRSEWITDGSLRASLRKVDRARSLRDRGAIVRAWHPFDSPQPVPLAEPVEYVIDVIATSNVFAKGHRLRLDLVPAAAADTPRTGGAGAVTVLRDADHPSSLTVPLIPRRCGRSVPLVAEQPRFRGLREVVERGDRGAEAPREGSGEGLRRSGRGGRPPRRRSRTRAAGGRRERPAADRSAPTSRVAGKRVRTVAPGRVTLRLRGRDRGRGIARYDLFAAAVPRGARAPRIRPTAASAPRAARATGSR